MSHKSVGDVILDKLIEKIATGQYKVGEKLPNEFELMKELDVSRNSLREVIKILCAMGILEIRRADGTYVCSQLTPTVFDKIIYGLLLNSSSENELFEFRQIIDELTVNLVIQKINDDGKKLLETNLKEMDKAIKDGDMELVREKDYAFHMTLIDLCENSFYSRVLKGIYSIFYKYIMKELNQKENAVNAIQSHTKIYNSILSENPLEVKEAVSDSLSGWKQILETRKNQELFN